MALPTSTNNVTVRKLSSTLNSLWNKIKNLIGVKADKVSGATNGHFAGLDGNGNLTDSGKSASDFVAKTDGVTNVAYDTTNKKLTKTVNGTTTDIVSASTLKTDMALNNVTNDAQVKRTEMGAANGVATLDANGKIPANQIPGGYDDVQYGYYYSSKFYEDAEHTVEITPVENMIYVDYVSNFEYRWGGTSYVRVNEGVVLGETSTTAYRGDRGKAAYDHSQLTSGNPHNVTKNDVGLGNVDNTSDATKKANFTGAVASGNTGFPTGGDVNTAIQNAIGGITNEKLGHGYSSTSTLSNSTFSVTISNFVLVKFGVVSVKFSAAVPASALMNVNGTGAKPLYYEGSAIGADVIQNGDIGTFVYDGTNYILTGVDRSCKEMTDAEVTDLVGALT